MSVPIRVIRPNAAGIDIGSELLFVAVEGQEVCSFSTFTRDYQLLVKYLLSNGITSVAMEATGVYWYCLYEILEQSGLEVFLVNGGHMKNVPGRKSDVQDCQWIQQLHSYGLLRKSFIPGDSIRQLRSYMRLREDHLEMAAAHIQHMQKALTSMNIRLHQVISQITGVSGMSVIKAILEGQRDAHKLLLLCDKQIIKKKGDRVVLSLQGNYKAEHLFALQQAVEGYEFYQKQCVACDKQMELLLQQINEQLPKAEECPTIDQPKNARHHHPKIENLHKNLVNMNNGKDIATISGFTDKTFLKLTAEIGTSVDNWPTSHHFTSWMGLSPKTDQTGKTKRRRRNYAKTKAGQIFREVAMAIAESKYLALGSFYRRIRTKRGSKIAIVATARKLAVQYYNLIKHGVQFVEQGIQKYEEQQRLRLDHFLQKKAQELGYLLVIPQTGEVVH